MKILFTFGLIAGILSNVVFADSKNASNDYSRYQAASESSNSAFVLDMMKGQLRDGMAGKFKKQSDKDNRYNQNLMDQIDSEM